MVCKMVCISLFLLCSALVVRAQVLECNTATRFRLAVQLQWVKQAQFAGFYAALERGYYSDACLEIILSSGGPTVDYLTGLEKGTTQLLVHQPSVTFNTFNESYANRSSQTACHSPVTDLVLVSQVMQRNPFRLVTLKNRNLTTFDSLRGTTVGVWPGFEFESQPAMSAQTPPMIPGVDFEESNVWFSVEPLFSGDVDALPAMEFNELGLLLSRFRDDGSLYSISDFHLLKPSDFGGSMLFTGVWASAAWLNADPLHREAVERFLEATLRGFVAARDEEAEVVQLVFAGEEHQKYMIRSTNRHVWPSEHGGFGLTTATEWDRSISLHQMSFKFVRAQNVSLSFEDRVDLSMMRRVLERAVAAGVDTVAASYDEPLLRMCPDGEKVVVCLGTDSQDMTIVIVPVVILTLLVVVAAVVGTCLLRKLISQRQAYLKVYGDHALAETLAQAVLLWDMECLGELQQISKPSTLQRRFIGIAAQLVTIRPYIPASVIGIMQETAREVSGDSAVELPMAGGVGDDADKDSTYTRSQRQASATSLGSSINHSRPARSRAGSGKSLDRYGEPSRSRHPGGQDHLAAHARDRLAVGMTRRNAVVAVVKLFGIELLPHVGTYSLPALYTVVVDAAMRAAGHGGVVSIGPDGMLMTTWNSATVCSAGCDSALAFAASLSEPIRKVAAAFNLGTGVTGVATGALRVGVGIARRTVIVGNVGTSSRMQHITPGLPKLAEGLARYAVSTAEPSCTYAVAADGACVNGAASAHLMLLRGLVSWPVNVVVSDWYAGRFSSSGEPPAAAGKGAEPAFGPRVHDVTQTMLVYTWFGHLAVAEDEWMYQLDAVRLARTPLDLFNSAFAAVVGISAAEAAAVGDVLVHDTEKAAAGADMATVTRLATAVANDVVVTFGRETFTARVGWARRVLDERGSGASFGHPVPLANTDVVCGRAGDVPAGSVARSPPQTAFPTPRTVSRADTPADSRRMVTPVTLGVPVESRGMSMELQDLADLH
eukprot:TRINITY_DN56197_c0_g1_i1.p1 TRINITY_DN56197_c0_g1~~TRINITY_DN56197_c0_g1_i1.p1  ORF type:complete len:998 (-),score=208.61 TRINITY_DN56197_c0_g1_i1:647-3640(-)